MEEVAVSLKKWHKMRKRGEEDGEGRNSAK